MLDDQQEIIEKQYTLIGTKDTQLTQQNELIEQQNARISELEQQLAEQPDIVIPEDIQQKADAFDYAVQVAQDKFNKEVTLDNFDKYLEALPNANEMNWGKFQKTMKSLLDLFY